MLHEIELAIPETFGYNYLNHYEFITRLQQITTTHHVQHFDPTSWFDVARNSHRHRHVHRMRHNVLHLTHHVLLLLLLGEQRICKHRFEIARLLQSIKWAEKHVFDLAEDFAIVSWSRCVREVEWFFDAQRLPVIRVVFETPRAFAILDQQHTTSTDWDCVFRVTVK